MNTGAQISSSYLTMQDLDNMAREIVTLSNKHGMKVVWKASVLHAASGEQHSITSKIIQKDIIIWKQSYSDRMWHISMALMYAGIHSFLINKDIEFRQWMQKMNKEKEERAQEARIASMPSWSEKIKQQL